MLSRVALPVLMWSTSAASGEEPPADQPVIELEVVTVTATKTERSAFEVPPSVSIVGPECIESEQPQPIDDLREELPNVEAVSGPRRIGESANIRGVDEARIVTTIDGARQNFNLAHQGRFFIEPGLLKQVEVYLGLRVDFGIDNLSDKSYRRHLWLIDKAGPNFKVSASYRF